jgi:hypothetical protein
MTNYKPSAVTGFLILAVALIGSTLTFGLPPSQVWGDFFLSVLFFIAILLPVSLACHYRKSRP